MWLVVRLSINEFIYLNFITALNICDLAFVYWGNIIADCQGCHHITQDLVLLTLLTNHHVVLFVVIVSHSLMLLARSFQHVHHVTAVILYAELAVLKVDLSANHVVHGQGTCFV